MRTRDHKLGVGKSALCYGWFAVQQLAADEISNFVGATVDLRQHLRRALRSGQSCECVNPLSGPVTDGLFVARLAGLNQFFCKFFVAFQIRLRWKRTGILPAV